jgi:dolichyl-phosphate beta-glucosyltransferase
VDVRNGTPAENNAIHNTQMSASVSDPLATHGMLVLSILSAAALVGSVFYIFFPAVEVFRRGARGKDTLDVLQNAERVSATNPPLISIIIPAYNEEERITIMLQEAFDYLSLKSCPALESLRQAVRHYNSLATVDSRTIEWIVVNDGSTDQTCQVYESFVRNIPKQQTPMTWKCLSLARNSGKGAAVQAGMLRAKGLFRLMVDADGATSFRPGLEAVTASLQGTQAPIVFGSRAHLEQTVQRSFVRTTLMKGFHILVEWLVGAHEIRDTQCGFKIFRDDAAAVLFETLHLQRWAFDTELVFVAHRLQLPMQEVAVPWHEVEGSKLHTSAFSLIVVAVQMLRDMLCVRLCYTFGLWKVVTLQPASKED